MNKIRPAVQALARHTTIRTPNLMTTKTMGSKRATQSKSRNRLSHDHNIFSHTHPRNLQKELENYIKMFYYVQCTYQGTNEPPDTGKKLPVHFHEVVIINQNCFDSLFVADHSRYTAPSRPTLTEELLGFMYLLQVGCADIANALITRKRRELSKGRRGPPSGHRKGPYA
jgi:hypothetical protein